MREILHFKSEKEKIAYLKGEFREILPKEVEEEPVEKQAVEEEPSEEKPKAKKKSSKKGKKDEVQAE